MNEYNVYSTILDSFLFGSLRRLRDSLTRILSLCSVHYAHTMCFIFNTITRKRTRRVVYNAGYSNPKKIERRNDRSDTCRRSEVYYYKILIETCLLSVTICARPFAYLILYHGVNNLGVLSARTIIFILYNVL